MGVSWGILGLAAALAACSGDDDCPTTAQSLKVTVRDSVTKEPICDAVVTVRFGGTSEELGGCPYQGSYHGPGAYDVTVEKSGYAPASTTILAAEDGECRTSDTLPIAVSLDPE
jgi:hypothetical protein